MEGLRTLNGKAVILDLVRLSPEPVPAGITRYKGMSWVKADISHWLVLTQYYTPEIGAPRIRLHALVREPNHECASTNGVAKYPAGRVFSSISGNSLITALRDPRPDVLFVEAQPL